MSKVTDYMRSALSKHSQREDIIATLNHMLHSELELEVIDQQGRRIKLDGFLLKNVCAALSSEYTNLQQESKDFETNLRMANRLLCDDPEGSVDEEV
jgi:hypothetical protein